MDPMLKFMKFLKKKSIIIYTAKILNDEILLTVINALIKSFELLEIFHFAPKSIQFYLNKINKFFIENFNDNSIHK